MKSLILHTHGITIVRRSIGRVATVGFIGMLATTFLVAPAEAASIGLTSVRCSGLPPAGQMIQAQSCAGSAGDAGVAETDAATADLLATSARASGSVLGENGTYRDDGVDLHSGSSASVSYYFDLIAPLGADFNLPVPVLIDAFLTTGVTGEGFLDHIWASASLGINPGGNFNNVPLATACSGFFLVCGDNPIATIDETFTAELYPFMGNLVSLSATAAIDSNEPGSASALVDPYIRIDPTFLADHPGYSLVFSSNITNGPTNTPPPDNNPPPTTSIPEPATAWLFACGLFGLIAARRRNPMQIVQKTRCYSARGLFGISNIGGSTPLLRSQSRRA
jgi:hypothetical protein